MCNHHAVHKEVTRTVLHERRLPALSVSQARNRCFLWNTRDALVVSCAELYTRQLYYFPWATCASRVAAKPKLRSPQMLTKSPTFYGTLRFTAVFTAARPFSQIHSVHTLHYFNKLPNLMYAHFTSLPLSPSSSAPKILYFLPHSCHLPCSTHLLSFHHIHYTRLAVQQHSAPNVDKETN